MQSKIGLKRVVAGKDVLGILAFMLLVSGMTTSSIFVHAGELLAATAAHLAPALAADAIGLLILVGIYLQAVVLAAIYRAVTGVYRELQRRARRAGSA